MTTLKIWINEKLELLAIDAPDIWNYKDEYL